MRERFLDAVTTSPNPSTPPRRRVRRIPHSADSADRLLGHDQGKWFVYAYRDERLNLLHPHLLETLFSVRKGLFFWSPLLLIALAGLPFLRRIAPGRLVPSLAYLAVSTWVIASWETWWYGGSLGQRPFVETLPVFALGLASLIETARHRFARTAVLAAAAVCSLLAVHAMVAYWLHAIPYDHTTWGIYLHSFHRCILSLDQLRTPPSTRAAVAAFRQTCPVRASLRSSASSSGQVFEIREVARAREIDCVVAVPTCEKRGGGSDLSGGSGVRLLLRDVAHADSLQWAGRRRAFSNTALGGWSRPSGTRR